MADGASARLRWAVDRVDPRPGERILEIGCGPGVAADLVCRRLGDGLFVGVDRSASAIQAAQRRCAAHAAAGTARFLQAEIARAALAEEAFDAIFAVRVAALADADPDTLAAVGALLAPGGRLLVIHDKPGADPAALGRGIALRLEAAGWTCVSVAVAAPGDGGMTAVEFRRRDTRPAG
jgi:SAM-dependent methyltransferase